MHSTLPLANFEVVKQPAFVLLRVKCPRLASSSSVHTVLSIPSPSISRSHSQPSGICGGPSLRTIKRYARSFPFIGSFVGRPSRSRFPTLPFIPSSRPPPHHLSRSSKHNGPHLSLIIPQSIGIPFRGTRHLRAAQTLVRQMATRSLAV